ncbi:MAG: hypothetical protein HWE25_11045 [Alphaproteobacteria bacterium]|nr:hypothetical protein [Alphaproteobacteria bacterium]
MFSTFIRLFVFAVLLTASKVASSEAGRWQLSDEGAAFVNHLGRESLHLTKGEGTYLGPDFHNGVIEFDMAFKELPGFPGFRFRDQDGGQTAEAFYLRPDVPGKPDANQYTPVFHGMYAWQIYTGARYAAPVGYNYEGWTHFKFVVKGDQMDVYIDSEEPVLHVESLVQGDSKGGITFHGTYQGDYYISNFRVEHRDDVLIKGTPAELKQLPEGAIRQFGVATTPISAKVIEGALTLDASLLSGLAWTSLPVGETGAANLDRLLKRTNADNTALVRLVIHADEAKTVQMRYGFSDRMVMFLNRRAVASGNDGYGTRDFQFMGTVGYHAGIFLPLQKGRNELVVAVTEIFGGWAFLGAIADREGIRIE